MVVGGLLAAYSWLLSGEDTVDEIEMLGPRMRRRGWAVEEDVVGFVEVRIGKVDVEIGREGVVGGGVGSMEKVGVGVLLVG